MAYQNAMTALADPRRRAIFEALRDGPKSVSVLAERQPVSRPAVSQHLKVLAEAGLITAASEGTKRIYRINPNGLVDLRAYIESFWQETLTAFATHVIENEKENNMLPPVIKTIDVPCSPDHAFDLFTKGIASWWPMDKNSVSAMSGEVAQNIELDAREGGEIWEIDHEGSRLLWGRITEFVPHSKLSISWHINKPETEATQVDVTFVAENGGTRVSLSHSGWEALGTDAEPMRKGYEGGWVHVFEECFKSACS